MTDQELIDAMVKRYVDDYSFWRGQEDCLCGFVDAHDAAYSSLSYVVQEAVDEAMEQISKGSTK